MSAVRPVVLICCLALGVAPFAALPDSRAATAQKKAKPRPKAKARTAPTAPPKVHAYRIQVRHPRWKRLGRFPNPSVARVAAAHARSAGWHTQVRRTGRTFAARARMPRWRTRGMVSNPRVAKALAQSARARGMQARVVPVRVR